MGFWAHFCGYVFPNTPLFSPYFVFIEGVFMRNENKADQLKKHFQIL